MAREPMPGALLGSTIRAASLVGSKDMRKETDSIARCETCGNDYSGPIRVTRDGGTHTYETFECAIQVDHH